MGLCRAEGENHFHWPASHTSFSEAQGMVGFLSCLMPSSSTTSTPKSFSAGLLLINSSPSLYRHWGMPWCSYRPGPCTWPSQTSQDWYGPTSLAWRTSGWHPFLSGNQLHLLSMASSTNLWGHTQTHDMSLVILNPTNHIMDSWGTALISDLHLDTERLIVNFWMQLTRQFLIYLTVHLSNPYLSYLVTKVMLWETPSKALQKESLYNYTINYNYI